MGVYGDVLGVAALVALCVDPEHELGEVLDDGLVEAGVADAPFVLLATVGLDQAWEEQFVVVQAFQ